jgi:hypothetical protein
VSGLIGTTFYVANEEALLSRPILLVMRYLSALGRFALAKQPKASLFQPRHPLFHNDIGQLAKLLNRWTILEQTRDACGLVRRVQRYTAPPLAWRAGKRRSPPQ